MRAEQDTQPIVLDIARRLAEEFDSVPLHVVGQAVQAATAGALISGDDVASARPVIERQAREDLTAIALATTEAAAG